MKKVEAVSSGLTTQKLILILGTVAIVCASIVVAIVLTRPKATAELPSDSSPIGNYVVDESNISDIRAELDEKVERGMFITYMNTTWTFPDGKSPSTDAVMGNNVNNQFAFWFDLTLGEETLYTSTLLPVGSQVNEIVLSQELPAGTYDAVLNVHMVDDEGEPVESNMGFSIQLKVNS